MGKKFDIHFHALDAEEQKHTFKFLTFGEGPAVGVKGLQMLVNQWLKCFLTPRGSDPTNLDYGTEFTNLIGSNISVADARDVTLVAIENCSDQVHRFQGRDRTLTSSERLGSAQLTRFTIDDSAPGFSAYVEIRNQANERLVMLLPGVLGHGD